jgi:dTDP-4-amino-4,6-dideoxygalactose transaminase
MTDIAAALGIVQLRRLDEMTARRRHIAELYADSLTDLPELQLPPAFSNRKSAWHLYILRLNLDKLNCDRATFIEKLAEENIGSSVHFIPLHLHPYYRDTFGYKPGALPISYREYQRVVSLPIYSRMTDQDVQDVIQAVRRVVTRVKLGASAG